MKHISLLCLSVAILNSIIIALDSGQFYQTQLYNKNFSFLYLGFVTSLLIECMIGLLFILAFAASKKVTRNWLLFLGSLILVLSFVSSSARHVLPKVDEVVDIRNKQKLDGVLNAELKRGRNTEKWLREKNQKLNVIVHERNQKRLFNAYVKNMKAQKSTFAPTLTVILIVFLKFLMQITAAIFFALSGHYTKVDMFLSKASGGFDEKVRDENLKEREQPTCSEESEEFDLRSMLKVMQKRANLSNRSIAEALGLKESVISNAMNKTGDIYSFLKREINNSNR